MDWIDHCAIFQGWSKMLLTVIERWVKSDCTGPEGLVLGVHGSRGSVSRVNLSHAVGLMQE